jgi:hypothetical protein
MAKNRFERVNEVQPDAITLSLTGSSNGEVGSVIFPASASGGKVRDDKIGGELPAVDCFRAAIKLANEMKVATVVMDLDGSGRTAGATSTALLASSMRTNFN